ncbi:MAG: hypothetical protein JWN94_1090 [Betaproteobacteria bacterium]|nr:hypothetical protein [Betaproteobacteria bacterium]
MKKLGRRAAWTVLALVAATVLVVVTNHGIKIAQHGSRISEAEVRAQVAAANYCTASADCAVASGDCPFVYEPVNVREQQKVAALYERYFAWEGSCMFSMLDNRDLDRLSCTLGKCVAALKGK